MAQPRNIILWTCHDMGVACNPYGDLNAPTPQLKRLAATGTTFTRNFCTTPLCSPSRGAMQTGRYPHVNGLIGLVNQGWDLPADQRCLVQHLAENGYATYLVGFQHIRKETASLAFEHHAQPGRDARTAGRLVADLLREPPKDKPFYIEVNTFEAHRPWTADDGSLEPLHIQVPPFWPDTPAVRDDLCGLYRHVMAVDEAAGTILDALEQSGRAGDTLFVFTVDHGIAFPGCKSTLYDTGLRTGLMLRCDGLVADDVRCDALLSNVDLAPTILDLAGVEPMRRLDGRSFAAHARGLTNAPHRQWVFAEKSWHDDYDPMRCVRTERWKYIRNLRPGPLLTLPADLIPERCATSRALNNRYLAPRPDEELYDIQEDPHEVANLAAEGSLKTTLDDLRGILDDWMAETDDPFLEHGYVPAPPENHRCSQLGRQWWPGQAGGDAE